MVMFTNRISTYPNSLLKVPSAVQPGFMMCPIGVRTAEAQTPEAAALTAFYAWAWQRVEAMQQRRAAAEPASGLQQRLFAVMN